jgi:hypothetical protein
MRWSGMYLCSITHQNINHSFLQGVVFCPRYRSTTLFVCRSQPTLALLQGSGYLPSPVLCDENEQKKKTQKSTDISQGYCGGTFSLQLRYVLLHGRANYEVR